jgi:signal transduction histidine kinase/DNA-binding NarL/FixJ family response regulator
MSDDRQAPTETSDNVALAEMRAELVRCRDELGQVRQELADTQTRMDVILRGLPLGITLFDADGVVVYSNNSVRAQDAGMTGGIRRQGVKLRDIIARQIAAGDHHYDDAGVPLTLEQRVARVLDADGSRSERELPCGNTFEFTFRRVSGGHTLGVSRNITDLKQRERELERARDAAEAANQAKSTFLATMSHEIRTPMNGVMGTAELLDRELVDDRQKRLIRTMRTSAAALLRIIDDVLDFSKIEAGHMALEQTPFSLQSLVESSIDTLSVQVARKRLRIATAIDANTPDLLCGDAVRIRQILLNLIGNAVKFTETGLITVSVRALAVTERTVRLAISVRDTGIGMTAEQARRVFQPFSQADNSTTRRYGGTGLGLSIVRRLAELMKGEASVESRPGEGSTFTVTMDLGIATEQASEGSPPTGKLTGDVVGRVLAVDDYPVNLEVLVAQLDILGVPVDTAASGLEALTLWRTNPYRLILTDIHMPDMDGLELARQIRSEETRAGGGPHIPIVALTANAVKGEADHCFAAGMNGYLTKPLTLDRLRTEIEWWLAGPRPEVESMQSGEAPRLNIAIDHGVLRNLFGDNKDLTDRVLARFAEAGARLMSEIVEATDDTTRCAEVAHKLKGAAGAAGAIRLGDLAAVVERSPGSAAIAQLADEWQRVLAALANRSRG